MILVFRSCFLTLSTVGIKRRRIRCFGHILNLVAKAFLFGLDAEADDFTAQADYLEQRQQYNEVREYWRKKGPVGKLHNLVKWIKASPQRLEAFREAAKESHKIQGFRLSEEPTFELCLRQNNATRWNSTYLMIEMAWK